MSTATPQAAARAGRADGSVGPDLAVDDVLGRLRESEARFRTMADCAPVLLWMAGTDGLCTFFNQGWLDFTGRAREREYGTGWAEGVHAEDFQACMSQYFAAFVARESFRIEYRLRRKDGQYRWLLDQGVPRFTPGGAFAGYVGSCIDITDQREARDALRRTNDELERLVQARTSELARSNADLEQFAHVASHDLQEPLRAVASYVSLLQTKYAGRLDADADRFIGHAVDGVSRMQALIRDILQYSRIGSNSVSRGAVDCGAAVELAVENLRRVVGETGAKVERDLLPTVAANRTQMVQLFQNLIENALKFRTEHPPQIHISADRQDHSWVFSVRDQGIGLDPEQGERIFRMFQRLHSRSEYPGTGIGLAVCRRIVDRLGGRIWVESRPGEGATFRFTVPDTSGDPPLAGP